MDFLKLPLPAAPDPAGFPQLLRASRHHPLFQGILQALRDHALGSLGDASTAAAAGESSAYQLGATAACCDFGLILHNMAMEPEPAAEQEGEG